MRLLEAIPAWYVVTLIGVLIPIIFIVFVLQVTRRHSSARDLTHMIEQFGYRMRAAFAAAEAKRRAPEKT
jgi:low affinity Fe/Cu permease